MTATPRLRRSKARAASSSAKSWTSRTSAVMPTSKTPKATSSASSSRSCRATLNNMSDVIIILAGGINIDGSLPEVPKLRVKKGVELFKQRVASNILMSGRWWFWAEHDFPKTEAQAMKEYAMSLGIPENAIYIEDESTDTVGNAYFCRFKFLD